MISFSFTDKVSVCISTGFKCPCAKKYSRSDSLLLPILYSFGKRTVVALSHAHFVREGAFCETSPAPTSVIAKCLNFVPSKNNEQVLQVFVPPSILLVEETLLLLRLLTGSNEVVLSK